MLVLPEPNAVVRSRYTKRIGYNVTGPLGNFTTWVNKDTGILGAMWLLHKPFNESGMGKKGVEIAWLAETLDHLKILLIRMPVCKLGMVRRRLTLALDIINSLKP